ncbi:MAG: hypothetical protein J6K03_06195 [Oscillospiraceae bacterium]|nr:hypothetical protein [Oscillospiraceae bacterium]
MEERRNRYKDLEQLMTVLLIATAVDFLLFLIFSGVGILWVKVVTAIFAILMPLLSLAFLYISQELLRQRSLWLTTGFASILVCTIVSLICNFPSPAI